jgi:hypothetical protein
MYQQLYRIEGINPHNIKFKNLLDNLELQYHQFQKSCSKIKPILEPAHASKLSFWRGA